MEVCCEIEKLKCFLTLVLYLILKNLVEKNKMHEQHRGHESMHAEMLFILLLTLTVAQIILVEWKKRHFKSYQVK